MLYASKMDQESSNQMEPHAPVQCRNGCGFYSNAGTEGLCSVCYKDMIKKKQQLPTTISSSSSSLVVPGAMASLSIDESSHSLDTASPTVFIPLQQTDKRADGDSESGGATHASPEVVDDPSPSNSLSSSSSSSSSQSETSSSSSPSSSPSDPTQKEGKKKKSRCLNCKKKVGLTGFTCRCGGLYCSIHRYSDKHECNFDYKELGAEEIRRCNPVIVAKKVQKI